MSGGRESSSNLKTPSAKLTHTLSSKIYSNIVQ